MTSGVVAFVNSLDDYLLSYRLSTVDTDLEESVDVVVLLVGTAWIPEHSLIRVPQEDGQTLGLHCAPGQGVDPAAGAVIHGGLGVGGGAGGRLPGQDTHQVNADIHRDHVRNTVTSDMRQND